ncbi:unnamed protein product [Discosporangium mesarthrocarpum]
MWGSGHSSPSKSRAGIEMPRGCGNEMTWGCVTFKEGERAPTHPPPMRFTVKCTCVFWMCVCVCVWVRVRGHLKLKGEFGTTGNSKSLLFECCLQWAIGRAPFVAWYFKLELCEYRSTCAVSGAVGHISKAGRKRHVMGQCSAV